MSLKTWKIKFKSSKFHDKVFTKWWHDYRYTYNKSVEFINIQETMYSKLFLRNIIVPSHVNQHIPWILDTPKSIREQAVFEAWKNKEAAKTNLKRKNIKHFELGYMTKRKPRWTIGIGKEGPKIIDNRTICIFPDITNNFKFRLSQKLPNHCYQGKKFLHECKIYYNGNNFYILICLEKVIKEKPHRKRCVALDPGVRTMFTGYDLSNNPIIIGQNRYLKIKRLLLKVNEYKSKGNKKEVIKLENYLNNIQLDLRHKATYYLVTNYKNIIFPYLNIKQFVKKIPNKEYRKNILRLGHGKFKDILKQKSKDYKTNLYIDNVSEMYSSRCLFINPKYSDKYKICTNCYLFIDRDINAAKNIYFMNKHLIN